MRRSRGSNKIVRICEECGQPFVRPYFYVCYKAAGRFCSRPCYLEYVQKPFGYTPAAIGSPQQIKQGYRLLACAVLRQAVRDGDTLFLQAEPTIALAEGLGIAPDVWERRLSIN